MSRKKIIAAHEPLQAEITENGGAGPPVAVLAVPNPKLTPTVTEQLHVLPGGYVVAQPPQPQPVSQTQPLKVALVGTAPSSRMLAPFGDNSWQIWACSPGNQGILPRVDAWFELHGNLLWPENQHYGVPYIEWLKKQPFPVYMQDKSYVDTAIVFPKDEMVKEFGKDFFTSSFAWMMALAITKGATEIALYGIDMASRDEYILQRPGFFFFKQKAQERGIKVFAPHESDIMQSPGLYGYSDVTPLGRKILARESEIKQRVAQMDGQIAQLSENRTYLRGALEDIDYFKSIWMGQG